MSWMNTRPSMTDTELLAGLTTVLLPLATYTRRLSWTISSSFGTAPMIPDPPMTVKLELSTTARPPAVGFWSTPKIVTFDVPWLLTYTSLHGVLLPVEGFVQVVSFAVTRKAPVPAALNRLPTTAEAGAANALRMSMIEVPV